jgi:uncharacterized repeat protein (TIGR03803 family)
MKVTALVFATTLVPSASFAQPSESLETLYAMRGSNGAPHGAPVIAADGTLYGVTQYGGIFYGSIFALHPDGGGGYTYEELYAFHAIDGLQPVAGLLLGSDGFLYGTTGYLISGGEGTVFRFDPEFRVLTTLHSFTGTDGALPQGALIEGGDGFFYGTTRLGGDMNYGTVYRIDASGNFTRLHSFSDTDGREPFGKLYRAANGDLYGTVSSGAGPNDQGAVFRIDGNGTTSIVHAFSGSPTDGGVPKGGMILAGDGKLYGATAGGGANGEGALYRITLPATLEVFYSFNGTDGTSPYDDLALSESDGTIVGTTNSGGTHDLGTVYRLTLPGTVSSLHSFDGSDGKTPYSGVVVAESGDIFGVTWFGGPEEMGVVYQLDGSGETVIHPFRPEGASPRAALIEASNGKLYGTATTYPFGSIFEWDPVAESIRFPVTIRDSEMAMPLGALVESGEWFYGTSYGDPYNLAGAVFRAKLDGTVEPVHIFSNSDGARPYAGLLLASDGNFYGTTHDGGVGVGTLFKIDALGNFTSFGDFDQGPVGSAPCGRLIEASPGQFYGTLESGGPGNGGGGSVFQSDASGAAQLVHAFSFYDDPAFQPCSDITLGSDGFFYGTTVFGRIPPGTDSGYGAVYRVSSAGDETTLCQFHGSDGANPLAGVTETSAGVFYGTTVNGGASDLGTIFRVDSSGRFDSLYSFDGPYTGSHPYATMLRASDGYLYGTTNQGGWWGGMLFRFSAGSPTVTVSPTSGPAVGGTEIAITGARFAPDASVLVGPLLAPNFVIVSPTNATGVTPALTPGTLNHVMVLNRDFSSAMVIEGWLADFLDVPQADPFHAFVETIVRRHIAAGYGDGRYGRDDSVTRAQMAVLILKAKHGSGYVPPPCSGVFGDTPCPGPFTAWVEQLAAEGIAAGCGGGNYCPDSAVRRDQMAPFLLKAEHGSNYVPPVCAGVFSDVACPSLFADWIEQFAAEGITAGCGAGKYCPASPNTRAQMAVFLTKTFSLN